MGSSQNLGCPRVINLVQIIELANILHTYFIFKMGFIQDLFETAQVICCCPTLEGAGCLLSQSKVLLCQMVHWLVLVDLHTGADVTIAVQEEGEGAGKMLTVKKKKKKDKEKFVWH